MAGSERDFRFNEMKEGGGERMGTMEIHHNDTGQAAARLKSASKSLHDMAPRVARAYA